MAGGELEPVMTAVRALPADAAQAPDVVLAERMQQLVQLRAMVDAALIAQLAVFDARASARHPWPGVARGGAVDMQFRHAFPVSFRVST